jgi:hypothetical protein
MTGCIHQKRLSFAPATQQLQQNLTRSLADEKSGNCIAAIV